MEAIETRSSSVQMAYRLGSNVHVSLYGMYGYAISTNFRRTMDFAVRYHQLAAPLAFISFAEAHRNGIWTIEPVPSSTRRAQPAARAA